MEKMLVRLKPHEPRRGYVLRRFAYRGITFHADRGWYRVEKPVADYLGAVRQEPADARSPLAFEVYTEREAKNLEVREETEAREKKRTVEAPTVEAREPPGDAPKERRARSAKPAAEPKKEANAS